MGEPGLFKLLFEFEDWWVRSEDCKRSDEAGTQFTISHFELMQFFISFRCSSHLLTIKLLIIGLGDVTGEFFKLSIQFSGNKWLESDLEDDDDDDDDCNNNSVDDCNRSDDDFLETQLTISHLLLMQFPFNSLDCSSHLTIKLLTGDVEGEQFFLFWVSVSSKGFNVEEDCSDDFPITQLTISHLLMQSFISLHCSLPSHLNLLINGFGDVAGEQFFKCLLLFCWGWIEVELVELLQFWLLLFKEQFLSSMHPIGIVFEQFVVEVEVEVDLLLLLLIKALETLDFGFWVVWVCCNCNAFNWFNEFNDMIFLSSIFSESSIWSQFELLLFLFLSDFDI